MNHHLLALEKIVTDDPILEKHKFTNCFRACDRVSSIWARSIHRVFSLTLGLARNMGVSRTIMAGWVPYSKWKEAATLSLTNNKSKPLELSKKGQRSPTAYRAGGSNAARSHGFPGERLSSFRKTLPLHPEPRTGQKLPDLCRRSSSQGFSGGIPPHR